MDVVWRVRSSQSQLWMEGSGLSGFIAPSRWECSVVSWSDRSVRRKRNVGNRSSLGVGGSRWDRQRATVVLHRFSAAPIPRRGSRVPILCLEITDNARPPSTMRKYSSDHLILIKKVNVQTRWAFQQRGSITREVVRAVNINSMSLSIDVSFSPAYENALQG